MIDMNKQYKTVNGRKVRILCVDGPDPDWPVIGVIDGDHLMSIWTSNGHYNIGHRTRCDLEEVNQYADFKIDDPVVVINEYPDGPKYRYFAGVNAEGKPTVFSYGLTSWTSGGFPRLVVQNCRRPTVFELNDRRFES